MKLLLRAKRGVRVRAHLGLRPEAPLKRVIVVQRDAAPDAHLGLRPEAPLKRETRAVDVDRAGDSPRAPARGSVEARATGRARPFSGPLTSGSGPRLR